MTGKYALVHVQIVSDSTSGKEKPAANSSVQASSEPDKASARAHKTAESVSKITDANGKDAGAAPQQPDKIAPAPQQQATVQATGSAALLARIRY